MIGARKGGVLHYEYVYLPDKNYIDALATAQFATLEEVAGDPNDPFKGEKGLRIVLTDRGKELLRALDVTVVKPAEKK